YRDSVVGAPGAERREVEDEGAAAGHRPAQELGAVSPFGRDVRDVGCAHGAKTPYPRRCARCPQLRDLFLPRLPVATPGGHGASPAMERTRRLSRCLYRRSAAPDC